MNLSFGKHAGKSVALLVLKEPGYVRWVLSQQSPSGPLARAADEARRLIGHFDGKPLLEDCLDCGAAATRCSVYRWNLRPYWWCDGCDPYGLGAAPGRLGVVRTYRDAALHARLHCGGSQKDLKTLIRTLAEAKGLPARVGEFQAAGFFGRPGPAGVERRGKHNPLFMPLPTPEDPAA